MIHTAKARDGIVRVARVGRHSRHRISELTIKREGYEDHVFSYNWEGVSRSIPPDPDRDQNVIPVSRVGPVIIPLEPKN